jgi:hypothetical protein
MLSAMPDMARAGIDAAIAHATRLSESIRSALASRSTTTPGTNKGRTTGHRRRLKPYDDPADKRLARKVFKSTSDNDRRAKSYFEVTGSVFAALETPAGAN